MMSKTRSFSNRSFLFFFTLPNTSLFHLLKEKVASDSDVDRDAWEYMRKKGRDVEVEPPQRMMTCSQTRAAAEDQEQSSLELRSIAKWSVIDRRTRAPASIVFVEATDERGSIAPDRAPICSWSCSCCARAHTGLYLTFLRFYLLNQRSFTYLSSIRVLKSLFRISLVLGLCIHIYSLQRTQFLIIIL